MSRPYASHGTMRTNDDEYMQVLSVVLRGLINGWAADMYMYMTVLS